MYRLGSSNRQKDVKSEARSKDVWTSNASRFLRSGVVPTWSSGTAIPGRQGDAVPMFMGRKAYIRRLPVPEEPALVPIEEEPYHEEEAETVVVRHTPMDPVIGTQRRKQIIKERRAMKVLSPMSSPMGTGLLIGLLFLGILLVLLVAR